MKEKVHSYEELESTVPIKEKTLSAYKSKNLLSPIPSLPLDIFALFSSYGVFNVLRERLEAISFYLLIYFHLSIFWRP